MLGFNVTGQVQGVFFRRTTITTAQSLSLHGWVMNVADGSVIGQAQGLKENLDQLVEYLHRGPPTAHVEHVEIQEKADNPALYEREFGPRK
ncbi:Acylphosphatase [Tilletiaria anomala UBC 951]|uniref:Acylphosphatase n=1 Tax=Tilletiaria anomala (strain ATCC 24038 / CBS 436.72 / UBC 951) TaxID=1037660 RepID=A0A066VY34_TILAU|nr:Acylphosphatase [Tilletiaria anomala UBC 951]KDN43440.1 Acylphosphatase [Tilletiaria anomala UBC 951]